MASTHSLPPSVGGSVTAFLILELEQRTGGQRLSHLASSGLPGLCVRTLTEGRSVHGLLFSLPLQAGAMRDG